MEKERGAKVIALVALVIGIVGLSVGFAGWTAQLTISDALVRVRGGGADASSQLFGQLLTVSDVKCDDIVGAATVQQVGSASAHAWTGTEVTLTTKGDSVTCTATVSNASDYTAYLDDIKILNNITCTGVGQNVQNTCKALKLTVTGKGTTESVATVQDTSISNATNITGNSISAGATGQIKLKVEYVGDQVSDSDFSATIPSVTFDYSTVD